jgi:hypothetical protein
MSNPIARNCRGNDAGGLQIRVPALKTTLLFSPCSLSNVGEEYDHGMAHIELKRLDPV